MNFLKNPKQVFFAIIVALYAWLITGWGVASYEVKGYLDEKEFRVTAEQIIQVPHGRSRYENVGIYVTEYGTKIERNLSPIGVSNFVPGKSYVVTASLLEITADPIKFAADDKRDKYFAVLLFLSLACFLFYIMECVLIPGLTRSSNTVS